MLNSRPVKCYNCKSVILNLQSTELEKLDGLTFQCECCGYENLLLKDRFFKADTNDPYLNIFSVESILI